VNDWWQLINMLKQFVGKQKLKTINESNKQLQPVVLDDGSKIYGFVRYGFWKKQNAVNLAEVINVNTLKELKSKHGYMVVYTHLGSNSGSEYFIPEESQKALRHLADEFRKGEIYVTTISKLLKYNLAQTRLDR
jgi:glycine/serine hydroxymethyltransferase